MSLSLHTKLLSTVGLWQFAGDVLDASGNGFTLTPTTGMALFADVWPGMFALNSKTMVLARSAYTAALDLPGDMTYEAIIALEEAFPPGAEVVFCSHFWTSGHQYQLRLTSAGLVWSQDAASVTFSTKMLAVSQIFHLAVSRRQNVVRFYLNGALQDQSGALTAPAAGDTTGRFRMGSDTLNAPSMIIASVRLSNRGLTNSEISNSYRKTMGDVFGY